MQNRSNNFSSAIREKKKKEQKSKKQKETGQTNDKHIPHNNREDIYIFVKAHSY